MADSSAENVLELFREALKAPASERADAARALRWLALVPCWPEKVAEQGFPLVTTVATGAPVRALLQDLVTGGWVDYVDAVAPWDGSVYRMRSEQRRRVFEIEGRREHRDRSLLDEAAAARRQLQSASSSFSLPYPVVIRHWMNLLRSADNGGVVQATSVADCLVEDVRASLARARDLQLEGSPEATTILESAEPLVMALGGPLLIGAARCQRDLELQQRRIRDTRLLRNYQERPLLDRAFEQLLGDDSRWALHFIGQGGVGKTMFLRHLESKYGDRQAISRVDFDHLNPSYPLRSPGLLLLSFADELKLAAPESAIDLFHRLEIGVGRVHADLDAARRDGREVKLGYNAAGFETCLVFFADALMAIERSGRRPVLILDTCEELARLRFDGELPNTLVETFRILEDLHRRAPALRVVFSGRRPLAREGVDWAWDKEALPKREYLRLCPIFGFNRDEALALLQRYRVTREHGERSIPDDSRESILELSESVNGDTPSRLLHKTAAGDFVPAAHESSVRYNPFDVDLYGGWAAADPSLTADKLRRAGRHHYVRERIVSRLRDDVQKILPHLAVLGRFDEALVGTLAAKTDDRKVLWAEVRQQEWADIDRGARDVADTGPAFWNVNDQVRRKLEAYYEDEMPGAWTRARHEVADTLERLTIERDWSFLTPTYFDICAETLRDDPARVAEWWRKVEAKILDANAWDWADSISAALLDPDGRLGVALQHDDRNPLAAPIRALRANVLMRSLVEDESLGRLWEQSGAASAQYPDSRGRVLLDFRARAGQVAYARYRPGVFTEETESAQGESVKRPSPGARLGAVIGRLPPLRAILDQVHSTDGAWQRQAIHTEMALLDNAVEMLEQVDWSSSRGDLVELLIQRAGDLANELESTPWVNLYLQRLKAMTGAPDQSWPWGVVWRAKIPGALRTPAFDWLPPVEQDVRRLLECGRLLERSNDAEEIRAFGKTALERVEVPSSLDEDRLLSQALRLLPESRPNLKELVQASIALAGKREECEAHRKVPPLFVTAIQLTAALGDIDAALAMLQSTRDGQPAEPVVRWLDRLSAYLNARFLLTEPAHVDIPLRDLPARESDPVAAFMKASADGLAFARDGKLTANDVARIRELAASVGFPVPKNVSELENVPAGWRPWLARYLALRWFAESRGDRVELEALKDTLIGFYGTSLPADVAFLDRSKSVASTTLELLSPLLGLGALLLFGYGGLALARAGLRYATGQSWTLWETGRGLFELFLLGGVIIIAVTFVLRQYTLVLGRLMHARSKLTILPDGRVSVETRRELNDAIAWLSRVLKVPPDVAVVAMPDLSPYSDLAMALRSARRGDSRRVSFTVFPYLVAILRIDHIIAMTGDGGPCWEAMLGTHSRFDLRRCEYAFRRIADNSWQAADPFDDILNIVAISSIRDLSGWRAALEKPERIKGSTLRAFPQSERRTDVGILIVQAEVSVSEDVGIRFSTHGGRAFTVDDVRRVFPNLRLFVLLGIDRGELTTRTESDRLTARQARQAAQELFRKAAPAVIAIPGLPLQTALVDEVLDIIVRRAIREHTDATWPLQRTVRQVQDRVFRKCGLDPDDATELAFDVCYYAADRVNMRVDIVQPEPPKATPPRKPSNRVRSNKRAQRSVQA
jgi:hypothetical protein